MSSDWSWTFASEYGRDRILRDRLDDLESVSSSARAEASRLRTSLAQAQGSLESRLTALSRAFDAYVELGDVREQLRAFTGTAEVRRYALRAVEALGQGRRPEPLPEDNTYWLVPAVAAVVARFDGQSDLDAEARATELDRDAELFLVVTLGMLGHGASVADRVPALLVTDTGLTVEQQALWQAVLDGQFGAEVLPAVRASLTPALRVDGDGVEMWRQWLLTAAPGADRLAELGWLRDQLAGAAPAAAAPTDGPPIRRAFGQPVLGQGFGQSETDPPAPTVTGVDRLKAVAARMIAEGRSDERDLLTRAQELREVIETPNAPVADTEERERADEVSVPKAVQDAIVAPPTTVATRRELLSWVSPVLVEVVDQVASDAIQGPVTVTVPTPGGQVEVSGTGADPAAVQRAKSNAADTPSNAGKRIGLTATAGALLVLAIIAFATGGSALPIILIVGALGAGVAAALAWRESRALQARRAADVTAVDQAIGAATARAAAADEVNAQTAAELRALHRDLTTLLTSTGS